VLDFGFDGAAKSFASASQATDNLRDFFANDDYYTDNDSNAYQLVKFIGNHDIGRLGREIDVHQSRRPMLNGWRARSWPTP
jgi:alpha-amylase